MKYIKVYEKIRTYELQQDFEIELSKYLTTAQSQDFDYRRGCISSSKIFLLLEDYGARISSIDYTYPFDSIDKQFIDYSVTLNSIKKTNPISQYVSKKKFRDGDLKATWESYPGKISIEDFVKTFIDRLKRMNDTRIKCRDIADAKKMIKKYNL